MDKRTIIMLKVTTLSEVQKDNMKYIENDKF